MSKTKGQRCQHTHQSLEAGKTRETKERTQQECSEAYEGTDKEAKAKRDSHQCWEITEGRQQETNPYTATNSKANSASLASGMCSKTCHVEGGKVLGGKNLYKTVSERHFNFCSAFCCFWYPILLWICLKCRCFITWLKGLHTIGSLLSMASKQWMMSWAWDLLISSCSRFCRNPPKT